MTKCNSSMMSHYLSLKPEVVVCQILKFVMCKNPPLKFERYTGGAQKIRRYWHIRRYWALSAIWEKNKYFRSKNEKRVGVGNDVICQAVFQLYKEFHDRFE
jgi:hypothetical protein